MDNNGVFYNDHPEVCRIEKIYYIHKHDISLEYGGPEEGGWWYTFGMPTGFSFGPITNEEAAYEQARALNNLESDRRKLQEEYDFTSVLAKMSNHYSYEVNDYEVPVVYPESRPHYE